MTVLSLENVSKQYKNYMLKSVNLTLRPGEIYGLIGNYNKDKHLLMKLISGLVQPSQGSVKIFDQVVSPDQYKHLDQVGFATPDIYFYRDLTGYDNIKMYLMPYKKRLSKVDQISIEARIRKYFHLFNLEKSMKVAVNQYSLGMIQKLRLIRAFIIEPKLIILDEPYQYLDPVTIHDLNQYIKKCASDFTAILVSTSMLEHLDQLVSRIGMLNKGQLIEELSIHDLHHQQQDYLSIKTSMLPKLLTVIERELNIYDYEVIDDETVHILDEISKDHNIMKVLHDAHIHVNEMKYGFNSLEDYFLERTSQI